MLGAGPDAEDLAQEAVASLLTNRGRLDADGIVRYAAVVTRNLVASHGRARSGFSVAGLAPGIPSPAHEPEESALLDAEQSAVRRAWHRLPAADREVLLLGVVEEWTAAECAVGSGRSPKAEALRMLRAKARLRVHVATEFRGGQDLRPRCEAVLVAVSARDVRRYDDLGGDGHVRYCRPCADLLPLLEKRRRDLL